MPSVNKLKSLRNHLDNLRIDIVDALTAVDRLIDSETEHTVNVSEIHNFSLSSLTPEHKVRID